MVTVENKNRVVWIALYALLGAWVLSGCTRNNDNHEQNPGNYDLVMATTTFSKSALFEIDSLNFGTFLDSETTIQVDERQLYQKMDGFGYSLTGGSALNIYSMNPDVRKEVIKDLFDCNTGKCVSYLRISIGASDLDEKVFSYDDLPSGQTDFPLEKFTIEQDKKYLIPTLKEIFKHQENIKIMASPWSAPSWMKTNGSTIGGSLKSEYYNVYARYLMKYIHFMEQEGITIDALTIQNEPQHGGNNPSMLMSAEEQSDFIKNHLGPLFSQNGVKTKIIIWDHNCNLYSFPLSILRDEKAYPYVDGSAFHLYEGDISAMSVVHNEFPEKNLYFTEQWTGANSDFKTDMVWHSRHLLIGASRNWAKIVLEWNLASNAAFGPHTPGGCSLCQGALTIDQNTYQYNVSYYLIAHLSRFVLPGSNRIFSSYFESYPNVAFLRPDGKKVLFIMNESASKKSINIQDGVHKFSISLAPSSINTIVW